MSATANDLPTQGGEAPAPHTGKTTNIKALDGLRGIAVLAVMVDHFSWSFTDKLPILKQYLSAGWMGVDLFFVLSGYLITRGLVKETGKPLGERLRLFWMRRALRIFPLYYIVLIVGTLACLAVGARGEIPGLSHWLYVQNYALALDGRVDLWTAHFWSLAVEEQFYFFWPLVVLVLARNRRVVAGMLFVSCIVARSFFAFRPHLLGAHLPQVAGFDETAVVIRFLYRGTPTHMDGLLLGAFLSMLEGGPQDKLLAAWRRWRGVIFAVSTAAVVGLLIVTQGFVAEDRRVVVVGYPLLALAFLSTLSLAVDQQFLPSVQRIFVSRPFVACGKVSYGMYIFHWPAVVVLAPYLERVAAAQSAAVGALIGFAVIVVGTIASFFLAQLSFRYVESWFLTLKEKFHD